MLGIYPRLFQVSLETRNRLSGEGTLQCANLRDAIAVFKQIGSVPLPPGGAINMLPRFGLALANRTRFLAITAAWTEGAGA